MNSSEPQRFVSEDSFVWIMCSVIRGLWVIIHFHVSSRPVFLASSKISVSTEPTDCLPYQELSVTVKFQGGLARKMGVISKYASSMDNWVLESRIMKEMTHQKTAPFQIVIFL